MKNILPRAAALLGISLGSALGGCVHITNTYSGMPGASQPAQTVAQNASGRDCGCPGQTGPAYSDGTYGYPYPAYYPQPYPSSPPSSDHYIYVPYGYPSQGGYPSHGGYYPRPGGNYSGGTGGTGSSGSPSRPVESTPRRPDSGRDAGTAYEPTVRGGADGSTVGINPNLGGTVSSPRGPRAEAPHSEEVRPNLPVGGGTRTGMPVSDAPERDSRPRTDVPVATGDRASAPHDVAVRPNIPAEPKTSTPVRDSKPAAGGATDAGARPNPDRTESRTPVRTNSSEPSKATTPAQGESVSSAAVPATSQPRNTQGSAATTAPVNSGASAQPATVGKAETAAPASSTGSQQRRNDAPAVKDAEKKTETVAPAATSQERSGSRAGEGSERATSDRGTSAVAAPAVPATSAGSAVRSGGTSSRTSSDTVRAADPVSRPKNAGALDGFAPSAATPAGAADAGVSNGKPR